MRDEVLTGSHSITQKKGGMEKQTVMVVRVMERLLSMYRANSGAMAVMHGRLVNKLG